LSINQWDEKGTTSIDLEMLQQELIAVKEKINNPENLKGRIEI